MDRAQLADAYLQALGLERQEPTAAFLSDIVARHVDRIPFSSIGPRLGDALPLDLDSLHDRLIVRRRGGYCFEQNRLAFEMLDELGFDVRLYLARVVYGGDPAPPLTHRVSIATVDGEPFVVDVGFGGIGPLAPIALHGPDPEPTWRAFRVTWPAPARFQVEAERRGAFIPLYVVDLVDYTESDCELGHFYSHRHPEALFVNHLVVMRTAVGEVRSLSDRTYMVLRPTGDEREEIASAERLHDVLTTAFDLEVTRDEARRLFAG